MTPETPMIDLQNVSQTFHTRKGEVWALDDITFSVKKNEFTTLVGRSGCGKSTLLRIIAGLVKPTSGTVTVDGQPVDKPRKDVSFMFQRPALLPWRTVAENVLLPAEILKLDKKESKERAHALLETVGLSAFTDRLPHELSGGMQQRVSLCRSLVQSPKVLLMDEPFSALDALTREEMAVELQRVQMEFSAAVVFVTHSIDEAVLLADQILVLSPRPGRLARTIPVDIPRPRTLGRDSHSDEVAEISGELHDLLMNPAATAGGKHG